jgi:uncharacterized protein YkwD
MKFLEHLAHLFIPRPSNNHKAKILHASSLTILALFIAVFQLTISLLPSFGLKVLGYAANISPDEVIRLTNEKRVANGFPALITSAVLSQAAQAKGADMLNKDYWAHVSPDGTQPWYFFTSFGYKYRYAGENLARDFQNPASAVEAWMASPSHKENMLSSKYKEIGIAVVEGDLAGVDTTIIVQFFGTNLVDTLPETPIAQAQAAAPTATPIPALVITATPTLTPTPTTAPAVVAKASPPTTGGATSRVLISPFNTTRSISLAVIVLLLVVMVVDGIITYRRGVFRMGGRPLAHMAFLGMILTIVLIARAGRIL